MTAINPINKDRETIIHFLKSNVSKTDSYNVETELKKDFVLAKTRSKEQRQKAPKKKVQTLSRAERKSLGFYNFSRKELKYCNFEPMHNIWKEYISEMLELNKVLPDMLCKTWESFTQILYKSDFHGSFLKVIRSKCPSYVDKMGICVMDTKNTFKIISKNNTLTTIPKKDCIFEMNAGDVKFTLFGKHLCVRPAERSTKKVKSIKHPDL